MLCVAFCVQKRGWDVDVPFRAVIGGCPGIAEGEALNHGLRGASFLFPSPVKPPLFQLTLSSFLLTPLSLSRPGEEHRAAGGPELKDTQLAAVSVPTIHPLQRAGAAPRDSTEPCTGG